MRGYTSLINGEIEMDTFRGFRRCPAWLRLKYREGARYICQLCHQEECVVGKLTPHRLKRGNAGGLYTVVPLKAPGSNILCVCKSCHKKLHQNNFTHCQSNK